MDLDESKTVISSEMEDVEMEDAEAATAPKRSRMTMRDRELAEGDDFYLNLRDHWLLKNPHERNDVIPEIMDGHNVADFFDEDIEASLNKLEEQEKAMEDGGFYEAGDLKDPDDDDPKIQDLRMTARKCVDGFFNI